MYIFITALLHVSLHRYIYGTDKFHITGKLIFQQRAYSGRGHIVSRQNQRCVGFFWLVGRVRMQNRRRRIVKVEKERVKYAREASRYVIYDHVHFYDYYTLFIKLCYIYIL